ncbi:MAG TPA: 16S rRNA (cytidine(1402)-2'-O)-methyltransferase [Vicinamibacterales bacterium]
MAGTLYVVATPIGNLEDITVRALRILREVALIAAEDTRRTAHLLTRYGITTPTTSLHEHNEHRKSASLIARLQQDENVALVSDAGTPTVSDPGQHLISDAIRSGIRVEAIPGPNAVMAALSVSGLGADSFVFLGFPPTKAKDRKLWMERLKETRSVAVFYEAPHRIVQTLEEIRVTIGDAYAVIGRELTKAHEELVRGPISRVLAGGLNAKGEFTVIVDIGQITDIESATGAEETRMADLVSEFGRMTADVSQTRRQAISALAKKYGLTARQAYEAVEAAKKSGS